MVAEAQRLVKRQHGVLTRAQARDLGLSTDQIDRRVDAGRWVPLMPEVYRVGADEGYLTLVAATVLWSGGVASHGCAAAIWGMDGFEQLRIFEVTTAHDRRHEGVTVHRADLEQRFVRVRHGIGLTSPARTLMDLGLWAHQDDVEGAMDFCLRKGWTTWDELTALVDVYAGRRHRGPAVLRGILKIRGEQRVHTESLLETRFLQLTRYARLPTPQLQLQLLDEERHVARVDFAWPDSDLLVETIGWRDHGSEPWQFDRDARRENRVTRLRKYATLKFTWSDVHQQSEQVCSTVAEALRLKWPPSARVLAATRAFAARLGAAHNALSRQLPATERR